MRWYRGKRAHTLDVSLTVTIWRITIRGRVPCADLHGTFFTDWTDPYRLLIGSIDFNILGPDPDARIFRTYLLFTHLDFGPRVDIHVYGRWTLFPFVICCCDFRG
jgi:hypothetical protein